MKIKDIIIECTDMLGMFDERIVLENADVENEFAAFENAEVKSLFNLCKFSIQELCSNYTPMLVASEIDVVEGKYPISSLNNYIRLQELLKEGEDVDYKVINRNIMVKEDGHYTVKYYSYPEINSLFDEVDFLDNFSPDVIVFGLCAYYCLSKGMFEDFNEFHDKYIDRAESLKSVKMFSLPVRRWE